MSHRLPRASAYPTSGPAPNFQKKARTVDTPPDSPEARAAMATKVRRIAIGSFAPLSISTVDESFDGKDWRRRMEKIAAASVDETITASKSERSTLHSKPQRSAPKVTPAVRSTPQVASPPAGSATARKSSRLVEKPP